MKNYFKDIGMGQNEKFLHAHFHMLDLEIDILNLCLGTLVHICLPFLIFLYVITLLQLSVS